MQSHLCDIPGGCGTILKEQVPWSRQRVFYGVPMERIARREKRSEDIQGENMYFRTPGEAKVNIAVLAYEDGILWECRNILYALMRRTAYNLGITLTKRPVVVVNEMTFIKGGLDVVVVADVYCEEKYGGLIESVRGGLNPTKFIFWDEENSKETSGTSVILAASKEELERRLKKEIDRLLENQVVL